MQTMLRSTVGTTLVSLALLTGTHATSYAQATQPAGSAKGGAATQPAEKAKGAVFVLPDKAKLMNPAGLTEKAPETFKVNFETSAGNFTVQVTRAWSPNGADRFYNLVKHGFYDGCRFFRVISGFMAQFGINGDPAIQEHWREATIPDDPVKQGNKRGYITFAKTGMPNSRSTQLFINFGDNSRSLDGQGFSSFGQVTQGMDVVDKLHAGYGEGAPRGQGPDQGKIQDKGNAYLTKDFPKLDYIKTARLVK
jgi:peptidyl-prolyl cis-trans isomerase A (cyclophilin A)